MRVAERYGTKSEIISLLPDIIQMLLAAPENVKSGVSDTVEAQIEAGEVRPTVKEVQAAIAYRLTHASAQAAA